MRRNRDDLTAKQTAIIAGTQNNCKIIDQLNVRLQAQSDRCIFRLGQKRPEYLLLALSVYRDLLLCCGWDGQAQAHHQYQAQGYPFSLHAVRSLSMCISVCPDRYKPLIHL